MVYDLYFNLSYDLNMAVENADENLNSDDSFSDSNLVNKS
jgi:hypothetical protein